jgi:hypothetical protein
MTLVLVGSGSLVRATCLALCVSEGLDGHPRDVAVLARNAEAAAELCHVATVRAALAGRALRFTARTIDPADAMAMAAALAELDPTGVLVGASTQSPWEPGDRPSAWTTAMRRAGLGLTLPFQAEVALAVGRAVQLSCPGAFVVNACFPDGVNALLASVGVPVLTGVGNVGILAAALQASLGLPDQSRLQVLAHHRHLHPPAAPEGEARAWVDDVPVTDVSTRLAVQRQFDRRGMNDVTGVLAAQLLADLLTGATRDGHLPGVAGRPGGYPVRVHGGSVTLRLPTGVDEEAAVRANLRWAEDDGVVVRARRVRFAPSVSEVLAEFLPPYADGFDTDELAEVTGTLHQLRERLRARPAVG